MKFLYETLDKESLLNVKIPNYIVNNLKYPIRPYQKEAFERFILYSDSLKEKKHEPLHLLYNMATGSGKTLVMAGLMLYLYEKGYRNFIFFVNSNNIIKKTKENFLNPFSTKYLFGENIVINNSRVQIKEVKNFEEADSENINIKFTTIQQLHIDLNSSKENSITYADLKYKKIALIADEAHHLSSATRKNSNIDKSWEGSVINILNQNRDNLLLEFTATLDYSSKEIIKKYKNRVIFRYDLAQFRLDGYSKEINLIRSNYAEEERIIQALILNLYRQELAASKGINLKPVILFKAKKTIKESEQNKLNFHKLIDNLTLDKIEKIKKSSTIEILNKAFKFFEKNNISLTEIVKRVKFNFKEENCISANSDKEANLNQIKLNTLEDENNPIRAVFAVQKLNEGWDVLNLFDIIRLYDSNSKINGAISKTTISEAQLIGRGARYFPFKIEDSQDPYRRKFDSDKSNELKILEELFYHTREDSRYILELKKALIDSGIYYENRNHKSSKKEFKTILNKDTNQKDINSLSNLNINKKNFIFRLSSGEGEVMSAFDRLENDHLESRDFMQLTINLSQIPIHIVKYALSQNSFFYFSNLKSYFNNLKSISDFITNTNYLGSLKITYKGTKTRLKEITNLDYLASLQTILQIIENELKNG